MVLSQTINSTNMSPLLFLKYIDSRLVWGTKKESGTVSERTVKEREGGAFHTGLLVRFDGSWAIKKFCPHLSIAQSLAEMHRSVLSQVTVDSCLLKQLCCRKMRLVNIQYYHNTFFIQALELNGFFVVFCSQEMEQSMNMLNPNPELPDVSEFMTKLFSKGSSKPAGGSKGSRSAAVKRR